MSNIKVFQYLTTNFYCDMSRIPEDDFTHDYLTAAGKHLSDLVSKSDGVVSNGLLHARIKYLLDGPTRDVDEAFQDALDHCVDPFYRAKTLAHMACYSIVTSKPIEHAQSYVDEAETICRENELRFHTIPILKFSMKRLRYMRYV